MLEFVLNHKKPIITVPRKAQYGEHINDHQVEFAEALQQKTGIKAIFNIDEITPELLATYKKTPHIKKEPLKKLQSFFIRAFKEIEDARYRN